MSNTKQYVYTIPALLVVVPLLRSATVVGAPVVVVSQSELKVINSDNKHDNVPAHVKLQMLP